MSWTIFAGVFLTVLGVLFWLDNLGYADFGRDWPVLLIIAGLWILLDPWIEKRRKR